MRLVLAACLALAVPSCAIASELRAALSQAPAALMETGRDRFVAFFGLRDLSAVSSTQGPAGYPNQQLFAIVSSEALEAYFGRDPEAWKARTGLERSDVSSFLLWGEPPSVATSWRFTDRSRVKPFMDFLKTRGFSEGVDGGVANGPPFMVDFKKIDPDDPFLGRLGRGSTIAPVGDGVVQSPNPKLVAAARATQGPDALTRPALAAALASVEKAATGAMPQATLFLPANDDGRVVIVADVQQGGQRSVVAAIGRKTCPEAEADAAGFLATWRGRRDLSGKTPLEETGAEPAATTQQAGGGCAAVISLAAKEAAKETGKPGDPVYRYMLAATVRRDFPPLESRRD